MADAPESAATDARYPKPRPKGEPQRVVAQREKIEAALQELYEAYLVDENGMYVLGLETARVFIAPTWLDENTTVIRLFAITNLDVPVTADLMRYLLAMNLEFVFGSFALDADRGAVWFTYNLLGEFAASEELEATLVAVSQTANEHDNEIKDLFGGRLYTDSPEETIPSPAVPGYL
jgi:hypothetical protein